MLKVLKFDHKKNKLLWLSDLHESHEPQWRPTLYQSRGFKTVQEHDKWFYEQWSKYVDENTVIFNLGDSTFYDPKGEKFRRLSLLPCKEHFYIWGNHLSGSLQGYKESLGIKDRDEFYERYPTKYNNITFVGQSLHIYVNGQSIYNQHYAQLIWPEMSKSGWCLVGHSHKNCKQLNPEYKFGKILDVGIDNSIKYNNSPFFSFEEIREVINKKEIVKLDHH